MTKAYLCSRFGRRDELRGYAERLFVERGIQVCSRWLFTEHTMQGDPDTEEGFMQNQRFAIEDLDDIANCDVLIAFTEEPFKLADSMSREALERLIGAARGGRHVEVGYAIALQKRIILVGPWENVFHYLPEIEHVANFSTLLHIVL